MRTFNALSPSLSIYEVLCPPYPPIQSWRWPTVSQPLIPSSLLFSSFPWGYIYILYQLSLSHLTHIVHPHNIPSDHDIAYEKSNTPSWEAIHAWNCIRKCTNNKIPMTLYYSLSLSNENNSLSSFLLLLISSLLLFLPFLYIFYLSPILLLALCLSYFSSPTTSLYSSNFFSLTLPIYKNKNILFHCFTFLIENWNTLYVLLFMSRRM